MVGRDLKPGDLVRFLGHPELGYGAVTEHCPSHGGYMVRPQGYDNAGGFGYEELEPYLLGVGYGPTPVPQHRPGKTAWQRLDTLDLTETPTRRTMGTR